MKRDHELVILEAFMWFYLRVSLNPKLCFVSMFNNIHNTIIHPSTKEVQLSRPNSQSPKNHKAHRNHDPQEGCGM